MAIGVFNRIHKYTVIDQAGSTTDFGNGPGVWVCTWCHQRAQKPPSMIDDAPIVDLWECRACSKQTNPVVMAGGGQWCVQCWEAMQVESGRLP